MPRMRAFLATCLVILMASPLASGCDLLGIGDDGVQLRMDQHSYTVAASTSVRLTVTNNYDKAIYYICTGQIFLEELDGDDVVDTWFVHGFEECLARKPIEPGASETFEMSFQWSLAPDRLDTARFDESVRYRLRVDLFESEEVDQVLEKEDRLSNKFRIIR